MPLQIYVNPYTLLSKYLFHKIFSINSLVDIVKPFSEVYQFKCFIKLDLCFKQITIFHYIKACNATTLCVWYWYNGLGYELFFYRLYKQKNTISLILLNFFFVIWQSKGEIFFLTYKYTQITFANKWSLRRRIKEKILHCAVAVKMHIYYARAGIHNFIDFI